MGIKCIHGALEIRDVSISSYSTNGIHNDIDFLFMLWLCRCFARCSVHFILRKHPVHSHSFAPTPPTFLLHTTYDDERASVAVNTLTFHVPRIDIWADVDDDVRAQKAPYYTCNKRACGCQPSYTEIHTNLIVNALRLSMVASSLRTRCDRFCLFLSRSKSIATARWSG